MENEEMINKYYREAVEGLNDIILEDKNFWYSYVTNLPIHQQVVYTIVVFHQQVFNGGLHQYFFNSYGQFAYLTLEHLRLIRATATADILKRALSEVNADRHELDEFREKIFNRRLDLIVDFDPKLSEFLKILDDQYDSLEGYEDLEQLLVDYLQGC